MLNASLMIGCLSLWITNNTTPNQNHKRLSFDTSSRNSINVIFEGFLTLNFNTLILFNTNFNTFIFNTVINLIKHLIFSVTYDKCLFFPKKEISPEVKKKKTN